MKPWARLICTLALAAVALAVVLQSTGPDSMAPSAVAADAGMVAMGDCDTCNGMETGSQPSGCDPVCGTGGMFALRTLSTDVSPVAGADSYALMQAPTVNGLSGPPAKQPPRFLL